jgi:streptomycin 6-kinase
MLNEYLTRWDLTPDGASIVTRGSRLLPVRQNGAPAMLKVAVHAEEKFGGLVMAWWDGDGAAQVLAHDRDAILLERATGGTSLADLARNEHDDEATRIICAVAGKLHTPRNNPPRGVIPLAQWFSDLEPASAQYGGILRLAAATARGLLSAPRDSVVLHGDIHHGNILDFGPRGWLAIDPKGLIGERGFDYANVFCNPDNETATAPGRVGRQVDVVAESAGLERRRLLQWIVAWAGLSAVWSLHDGLPSYTALGVLEFAAAELSC